MADEMNTSTIQHITALDFDISKIDEQFKEIENKTKNLVNNIDSILQKNQNLKIDFDEKTVKDDIKKMSSSLKEDIKIQLLNEDQLKNQIENVKKLTSSQASSVAASIIKENEKTVEFQRREQQKTSEITIRNAQEQATLQKKLDAQIALDREKNIQKQATLRLQSELKIQQEMIKQANKIDLAKTRKSLSETDESVIKKINTLYERSSTLVKNIRNSNIDNEELTAHINANLEESKLLWDKIHSGSQDVTDEIRNQVKQIDLQTDYLESQVRTIKNLNIPAPESTFSKWADSFKTAFAFRLTQYAEDAVVDTLKTLKDVEFGVMEITRVLNDSSINVQTFTHDIFDLATQYGRTFEEAQEIVLRFAQTGESAADSMKLAADTMLALNTAELNTEEATQSLIGVMQQWGYTTEEYLGVIDRINITADNFAVTSQDLVDALLKSSGVAKNAGLSFEELIGILTVMKEASGAAGKEVGNAAKTILTYIQRPQSLEAFDAMGIEVYANKLTGELLPAMEILQNMANKWNASDSQMQETFMNVADSAGLFNEEIAESIGAMEEYSGATDAYTKAMAEATTEEERNMATKAANVHRLNYYIALMENFSNVQEVINNMQKADGYSMQENAKYMDTLAAKWNQFTTTLKEAAYTAGEGGLTDLAKTILDIATNMVQLMTTTEGFVSVMTSLAGVFMIIKRNEIAGVFGELSTKIGSSLLYLKDFFVSIKNGVPNVVALKDAMGGMSAASIVGWAGVAVTALSLLTSAIIKAKEDAEKARQELIDLGNTAYEESSKLISLSTQYQQLQEVQDKTEAQEEQLKSINEQIIELLGERRAALDDLKQGTDEYTDSLIDLTNEELNQQLAQINSAKSAAESSYTTAKRDFRVGYDITTAAKEYARMATEIENMNEQIAESLRLGEEDEANKIQQSFRYQALTSYIKGLGPYIEDYVNLLSEEKTIVEKMNSDTYPETTEELQKMKEAIFGATGLGEYWRDTVYEIASQSLPSLSDSLNAASGSADELGSISQDVLDILSEYENVENEISSLSNAYSVLSSAIQEYNQNGALSIETLMKLLQLEPKYLQYIVDENGQLNLNENALKNVTLAQIEYNRVKALTQMLNMVANIQNETQALAILGGAYLEVAADADILTQAISNQISALQAAGTISEDTANKFRNMLAGLNQIADQAKESVEISVPTYSYSSSSTPSESWYKKQTEAFERLRRMGQVTTQDVISFYRQMANAANISADERIDAEDRLFDAIKQGLEETKQAQLDALNAQRDAIQKQADAEIDRLNKRKQEIEDAAQAEIDALRKVEKENDRIREKEEYLRNREEILSDLASAQARSGIDARKAEQQAKKDLEDLDRDWKEKLEDWDLEDRIEEIEAYRDAQLEAIDEQIAAVNEEKEARLAAIDEQIAAVNEKFNETNMNMIAYSAVFGDEMYNQYVGEFVEPFANGIVDGFYQAGSLMEESAYQNASNLNNIYSNQFINPLKNELSSTISSFESQLSSLKIPSLDSIGGQGEMYGPPKDLMWSNYKKNYSLSNNYSRTFNNQINVNNNIRDNVDVSRMGRSIINQMINSYQVLP